MLRCRKRGATEPQFEHVFISGGPGTTPEELERKLYVLRNYTVRVCLESVSRFTLVN